MRGGERVRRFRAPFVTDHDIAALVDGYAPPHPWVGWTPSGPLRARSAPALFLCGGNFRFLFSYDCGGL